MRNGSGWIVDSALSINLHLTKYSPTVGGSYLQLPKDIAKKSSLLNIKNETDDMCLAWCLAAARFRGKRQAAGLKPVSHGERTSHYREEMQLIKTDGIQFPVSDRDVSFRVS